MYVNFFTEKKKPGKFNFPKLVLKIFFAQDAPIFPSKSKKQEKPENE